MSKWLRRNKFLLWVIAYLLVFILPGLLIGPEGLDPQLLIGLE